MERRKKLNHVEILETNKNFEGKAHSRWKLIFLAKEESNYYMENDYLLIPSEVLIKHEMCPYIFDTKVLFYQAMTSNAVLHNFKFLPLERNKSFCSFASLVVKLDQLLTV